MTELQIFSKGVLATIACFSGGLLLSGPPRNTPAWRTIGYTPTILTTEHVQPFSPGYLSNQMASNSSLLETVNTAPSKYTLEYANPNIQEEQDGHSESRPEADEDSTTDALDIAFPTPPSCDDTYSKYLTSTGEDPDTYNASKPHSQYKMGFVKVINWLFNNKILSILILSVLSLHEQKRQSQARFTRLMWVTSQMALKETVEVLRARVDVLQYILLEYEGGDGEGGGSFQRAERKVETGFGVMGKVVGWIEGEVEEEDDAEEFETTDLQKALDRIEQLEREIKELACKISMLAGT